METINEHELLRKCNLLNEKHEKIKKEILERSIKNDMAILELNKIEDEYKIIIEQLKQISNNI
jgi:hypothetical protein